MPKTLSTRQIAARQLNSIPIHRTRSASILRAIADDTIKPRIERLKVVGEVEVIGSRSGAVPVANIASTQIHHTSAEVEGAGAENGNGDG